MLPAISGEKENEHNDYLNGLDGSVEIIETPPFDKKSFLICQMA